MMKAGIFVMLMILSILSGCGRSVEERRLAEWLGAERFEAVRRERLQDSTSPAVSAPIIVPPSAGPEDYVELALQRNPSIRTAEHQVLQAGQRVRQATSLEDPELMVSPVGQMADTAAGEVGLMTGVSQELPFPGKLETLGEIAMEETAQAAAALAETRQEVIAVTRQAYWNYYYASHAITTVEQSSELLRQLRGAAEARLKAGEASSQDVLRAAVELSELENEVLTLRQRLGAAAAALNALIDRPVDAELPPPLPARMEPVELRLEYLLSLAHDTNPELRQIRHRINAGRDRMKLAKLERWPDFNVGVNYNAVEDEGLSRVATGEDQWWLSLGLNLPIWAEKYEAAEREALHETLAAVSDLRRAHNHHASHLQQLVVDVESGQRQVILLRDVILPQARQALDASLTGYRTGRLEYLNIVENWRKLLDVQLMYHNALAELERDFAEIEQVVAQPLERHPVILGADDAPSPPQQQ